MARFFNAGVSTKNIEKLVEKRTFDYGEDVEHVICKAFKCVHVSFQSASYFNISTINALNDRKTPDMIRERWGFDNRRYCGIEMNEVRQLYLGTY